MRGAALMMGLVCLQKRHQSPVTALPREDTMRRWSSMNPEVALARHQASWCLDLRVPASRSVRNKYWLSGEGFRGILK